MVDTLVRKWLLRYGGDPSQYKKQTRAFDALAALADRIIRQHVSTRYAFAGTIIFLLYEYTYLLDLL